MRGWRRVRTHELDELSAPQYHQIANAHDTAGWESQRQGFTELRDLSEQLSQRCEEALTQLRRDWTGGGAEAFAAEFGKLIDLFNGLRDSAGTNAEGMRELATVIESTRKATELLNEEDKSWQSNKDGDDEQTVALMREGVRGEMRERIKEADEAFQHLAQSYLLDPPEPVRLGGMETIVHATDDPPQRIAAAGTASAPTSVPDTATAPASAVDPSPPPNLQSAPAHHAPAPVPEPAPAPVAEPAPVSGPMMPMGGMATGGPATADSGGAVRGDGPKFGEGRPVESSRMRSRSSRQDLHNQSGHGHNRYPDPKEERRPVKAEDEDSPFAPTETTVVPPIISGGVAYTGPHDSGPVLTGTVYRHFPEYGRNEPVEVIAENYEDGSSAVIAFGDHEPELAAPAPKPAASTRDETAQAELDKRLLTTRVDGEEYLRVLQGLPREKAQDFVTAQAELRKPTTDDPETKPETAPRKQISLDELRRRRQERRQARRKDPGN